MAKSHENPLLPHSRIRELFRAMLRSRALAPGLDAARTTIAVAIALRDLEARNVCAPDATLHPALSLAVGLTLRQVLAGVRTPSLQEPLSAQPMEQLYVALGASAASRVPALLLVASDALKPRQWQSLLADAAVLQAPTVLVALPGTQAGLLAFADRATVPGIPVDADDPIALYRVAAESFGRARAGGGPCLIEAVRLPGKADALALLRRQMIARQAATERWAAERERRAAAFAARQLKQVH